MGGGLGWLETLGHFSWTLGACHFSPASHGPLWGCHTAGPSPRSLSTETVLGTRAGQPGWGQGRQGGPPATRLSPCPSGSGEGIGDAPVTLV